MRRPGTTAEGAPDPIVRNSAICDFEDLCRLVGRQRPTLVKKWLQNNGILYWLNADGNPVTTGKALNDALLRGRKTEPNWNIGK